MIIDGDREDFLGVVLSDDMGVELMTEGYGSDELDRSQRGFLRGFLERGTFGGGGRFAFFGPFAFKQTSASRHAGIADADASRARDEFACLSGGFAAEGAVFGPIARHLD